MVVFFGLGKTVVPGWTLIFVGVHCFQQFSLYLLLLRTSRADHFLFNYSDLFLVNTLKSSLKRIKELLNHVKLAAPCAMLCLDKNTKLLLAVVMQISVINSICCKSACISGVKLYMHCFKFLSPKANVFLIKTNKKGAMHIVCKGYNSFI